MHKIKSKKSDFNTLLPFISTQKNMENTFVLITQGIDGSILINAMLVLRMVILFVVLCVSITHCFTIDQKAPFMHLITPLWFLWHFDVFSFHRRRYTNFSVISCINNDNYSSGLGLRVSLFPAWYPYLSFVVFPLIKLQI